MLDITSFGKHLFSYPDLPQEKKKKGHALPLKPSDHAKDRMAPIPTAFLVHCGFCAGVLSCNIERVPSSVFTLPLQKAWARACPLVKVMDDFLLII